MMSCHILQRTSLPHDDLKLLFGEKRSVDDIFAVVGAKNKREVRIVNWSTYSFCLSVCTPVESESDRTVLSDTSINCIKNPFKRINTHLYVLYCCCISFISFQG